MYNVVGRGLRYRDNGLNNDIILDTMPAALCINMTARWELCMTRILIPYYLIDTFIIKDVYRSVVILIDAYMSVSASVRVYQGNLIKCKIEGQK